jgi:DNA-binding beta-propeller fold protein YncE
MTPTRTARTDWLPCLLLLAVAGCGDEGDGAGPSDGTAPPDARASVDAGGAPLDAAGIPPDAAGARPDAGAPPASLDGGLDAALDASAALLVALASAPAYANVGERVALDGSGSTGAVAWQWDFGDGRGWDAPRDSPDAEVEYEAPGRYRAVLTVFGSDGARRTDVAVVTVVRAAVFEPRASATLVALPEGRLAVAGRDGDVVTILQHTPPDTLAVEARHATCAGPSSVSPWRGRIALACETDDAVALIDPDGEAPDVVLPLRYGAAPRAVLGVDDTLYVACADGRVRTATGPLDALEVDDGWAVPDPRGLALLPSGEVIASQWRSPDPEGRIWRLPAVEVVPLAFDDQLASDTEAGGVPSLLGAAAVAPDGRSMWVPGTQANIRQGMFLNGERLTHETTVRAILSGFDIGAGQSPVVTERTQARKQFDNRGLASAAVFSPRGDYLYVAMQGARSVERVDVFNGAQSGALIDVGYAPDGLVVSPDGAWLFVHASLSREVRVWPTADFGAVRASAAAAAVYAEEPLGPAILRGKQLFNDSFDRRLTRDGYIACAHCHPDGGTDGRVWDFTDRGEGLRRTTTLHGRAGLAHGPLHWSANFDEVQDFEHDIRGPFAGAGLMEDADFEVGTRDTTLGEPKAGISEDLDALAAYVTSLDAYPRSPFRTADGALTPAAARGRLIFESAEAGCTGCHTGDVLTDSGFDAQGLPLLHDVGTLGAGSGHRLGGPLDGIDTPTLHGIWATAPYLHDGSAPDIDAVLGPRNADDRHGRTTHLDAGARADLESYLLSLDGRAD